MKIEFKASNGKNTVYADTALLATMGFLERYRNRTFIVCEYRDGTHRFQFPPSPDDYFSISFKSRAEAQAFVDAQQTLAA